MEDKMRIERISIKQAVDATSKKEKDAAVNACKLVSNVTATSCIKHIA